MADLGLVKTLLGGLEDRVKRALSAAFEHVLGELSYGPADADTGSLNFSGHFYEGTTSSVADREVAVAHQFGTAPYLVMPVLPVGAGSSGVSMVPLTTTRPADAQYIYVSSPTTGATFRLYAEG